MPKFDFSGWATRFNTKCSDGRTILSGAFDDNDGQTVPLVWQHKHDSPSNILGHALLEKREDGMYTYCTFNDTDLGKNAKELVKHGDITSLSIYANRLKEHEGEVAHGMIREVSLVLTGANPGAYIETVSIAHEAEGEFSAVIYNDNEDLCHGEEREEESMNELEHADEKTVRDVYNTLNDEQKELVNFIVGAILDGSMEHSDEVESEEVIGHAEEEVEVEEDMDIKEALGILAAEALDSLSHEDVDNADDIAALNAIKERYAELDEEDVEYAVDLITKYVDLEDEADDEIDE